MPRIARIGRRPEIDFEQAGDGNDEIAANEEPSAGQHAAGPFCEINERASRSSVKAGLTGGNLRDLKGACRARRCWHGSHYFRIGGYAMADIRTGYPTGAAAAPGAIAGVEVIGARRPISSAAIFAPRLVVLPLQLLLTILGLGIGLSFVHPSEANSPNPATLAPGPR